tara:strand:+ start:605 stop:847 length:243 start_codon:yes stop_codon:yes gene_type:complete
MSEPRVGSKTQAQLATLDTKVEMLERELHLIRQKMADHQKINWLVVIGSITLTVTLLGVISEAWLAPINLELQHIKELIK